MRNVEAALSFSVAQLPHRVTVFLSNGVRWKGVLLLKLLLHLDG